ncbi:kelch domain-containing protein 7B [Ctenodactylus gundi]
MAQGALGASGPLWGWDGEGDDDWDAAALALLGLAVVAATALALHWLGFGQDQGEAGPAPAAHGGQPGLLPSAGGQRSGLERPEPGRRGHQSAAIAEARDPESPGVRDPAPLQMPGEAAGAETLGQGRITGPGSPQGKGRTSPRPDAALPGGSDAAAGTPAPLLIRFTPRSPGCSAGLRADAGAAGATHQIPFREEPPDASPPGRGQGGRRRRTEPGSRDRTSRRRRPDPLRLGTAASVWDAVDALGPRPSPGSEAAERRRLQPGPALRCQESAMVLRVGLSKGDREGQISTSWGNLIAMVLRSHPFPRQDRPQENAPKATPGSPTGPQTPTHLEDRLAGSGSEEAVSSFQDRPSSSLGTVPPAGAGGPAEAGCQMQPMSWETKGDPTLSPTPGPRGGGAREKGLDSVLPAALLGPSSQPPRQGQPGPTVSPVRRGDSPPVPKPRRKHSICEIAQSSEGVILQATLEPPQQPRPGQGARPASGKRILTEKQKDAQKLMVFLQRPGNWGVVEGPQNPHLKASESAVPWPQRLDLGSCLEVLAFAQQRGEPSLAQETYALMSSNLLRVLGDPHLYRQLSGAERERILSLRTRGGQTVLGVLVLPSLYQVGRSGLLRGSHRKEDPAAQPVPQVPRPHLHVFSPQDNRWWPLTQVPEEAPLRGCGLCTMYNYLFLAGGVRGSGAEAICSNEVFCYNPLTNIWSQVRPMQQARAQLKLVALDGLIYAIGGECLYSMERYDPRTDAWTSRAPLPAGTFPVAHEAVACRGDIYVTGGHLFYRLLRYSPMKDAWDECPYSASHRRSSDMVALGGFLYRFDLLRGVGAAVMRYNTVTGSWSRAASLPLPDPAPLRCTVLGNTIYCLNHQVTATFTVSEGTAQFQAKELQPFPMGSKGVLCPFILTLPPEARLQTSL